jgi:hypothetical protein
MPLAKAESAAPSLVIPEKLPVFLSWQKWSSGADGWTLTSQVSRRNGKLPQGSHLHFVSQPGAGETILVLPVRTLNQSISSPTRRRVHLVGFQRAKAKVRVPISKSASNVVVSYCEDEAHLAAPKA